ncbi:uncharacterized protein BJX67DRAFT_220246 [Aspergillus lucknowensis]|uniref:Uncharacterized protein n=1 Tax=Aspergillus lucknowensis TaxID=176173 RepID=A0ABR4LIV3_9EURO
MSAHYCFDCPMHQDHNKGHCGDNKLLPRPLTVLSTSDSASHSLKRVKVKFSPQFRPCGDLVVWRLAFFTFFLLLLKLAPSSPLLASILLLSAIVLLTFHLITPPSSRSPALRLLIPSSSFQVDLGKPLCLVLLHPASSLCTIYLVVLVKNTRFSF